MRFRQAISLISVWLFVLRVKTLGGNYFRIIRSSIASFSLLSFVTQDHEMAMKEKPAVCLKMCARDGLFAVCDYRDREAWPMDVHDKTCRHRLAN